MHARHGDGHAEMLLLLGFCFYFLEKFPGILFKVGDAVFTAELHFLSVLDDDGRFAHLTEFFTGDDAGGEGIGFADDFLLAGDGEAESE